MKKLLSLLSLLLVTAGAWANHWENTRTGNPQDRTVIFAELVCNQTFSTYEVAAFIGDECRWSGTPSTRNNESFLEIEVPGNYGTEDDEGKEITFKIYVNNMEFDLTPSETITWGPETTYGNPGKPRISLTLNYPTQFDLEDIFINVGETVNLLDYLTITPADAQMPLNYSWYVPSAHATLDGDNITGVEPTEYPETYDLSIGGNPVTRAQLTVELRATAINIVTENFTVDKDDAVALTQFMLNDGRSAYVTTPEDITETVQWELKSDGVIVDTNNEFRWNPAKGGTTQIRPFITHRDGTKLYPANNKWINVTVNVPVQEITFDWPNNSFPCNVGDDIYSRLTQYISVSPDDATNKSYHFEVNSRSSQYLSVDDNSIVALKESTWVPLTVVSDDDPNIARSISVSIFDPLKMVSFTSNPLVIDVQTSVADAIQMIKGNITHEGVRPQANGQISVTGVITGSGTISTENQVDVYLNLDQETLSQGTATVAVTLTWNDYSNYDGTQATLVQQTWNGSFTVMITAGLEGFTFVVTPDDDDPTQGTITLQPQPETADFSWDDYDLTVSSYYNEDWDVITVTKTGDGTYTYDAELPGFYYLTVDATDSYDWFEVPAKVSFNEGWQWRSNPYGTVFEMHDFFGDDLVEARTQQQLLYNDANWGYYGSLASGMIFQSEMYKVKMGTANTVYLYTQQESSNYVYLESGWNWLGSPYFYNRLINNCIGESEEYDLTGVVIVSKNNGSVEFDGSQWRGDLASMKTCQGYLVYNPNADPIAIYLNEEGSMSQGHEDGGNGSGAPARPGTRVWNYDHTQFASNMTMVAQMPELANAEEYTIGAFVGDECRGEGRYYDGLFFITVHLNGSEQVHFRLHNETTGDFFDIDETMKSRTRLGSLSEPVLLHSQAEATGISQMAASAASDASGIYNMGGVRQDDMRRGLNIIRKSDGTVTKVLVK